jgi:futalosine hydrolase
VPTEAELDGLRRAAPLPAGGPLVAVCGFGPVAAAARAAQLCTTLTPGRVWLVGIAGTYDERLAPVGSAFAAEAVRQHGIGAGEGAGHVAAEQLGFAHLPHAPLDGTTVPAERTPVRDELALHVPAHLPPDARIARLLSVCSAAGSPAEATARAARASAQLEDMEAFGVAVACAQAGVPLTVIRGVSNPAGNRDHASWRIGEALAAARALLGDALGTPEPEAAHP